MISVKSLSKRFGAQVAVDQLSFEVPPGQIVGFLGPNGAGKSTTLKMLTGMIQPTGGTATICGFDLLRDAIEVKRRVGFVPESGAVFESLTGLEYLDMIAALYGIYALVPCLGGKAVPLSVPNDEARAASRGLMVLGVMSIALALAGLGPWARSRGWFWWFLLAEALVGAGLYVPMRLAIAAARWSALE